MIHKSYFPDDLTVHDGERAVVAKVCVPVVDADGEVVMPQGCDATRFEINPVVFFSHSYKIPALAALPPVGRCVGMKRTSDALICKTVFPERPANHPADKEWLPDTLFSLYQQKVLRGFSVGFEEIEARAATKGDKERFGPQCKTVYSKWRMLEYSVAPIPANPETIAIAVSKGIITPERCKSLFAADPQLDAKLAALAALPQGQPPAPATATASPRSFVMLYRQKSLPPQPVDVSAIVSRYIDKRCGVLYSD